ncbi:hypothetical protein TOC8171_15550 [Pseudomonas syringae]
MRQRVWAWRAGLWWCGYGDVMPDGCAGVRVCKCCEGMKRRIALLVNRIQLTDSGRFTVMAGATDNARDLP